MKSRSECVDTARQALNLFTSEELEDYIKSVASKTRELQIEGVPFARNAAIKDINKGHLATLFEDSARAARNMGKFDTLKIKMDTGIEPQSFLEKTAKNTDYNVETASNAAKQVLHNKSFGKMSKEELDVLTTGEMDDAIYAFADGVESENPLIRSMGSALREYPDSRNSMLIRSDAMKPAELNEDRFFRNTYNPSKLNAMGKENWVALQKSLINIEETFKNTRAMNLDGDIDDAIVNEMIGNTFDNIIQGNGPLFTKAVVGKDWGKIERARHMFYKYKDWKSYGIANKEFGQGSLFKSWLMDINSSGQQTGMAQIMGSAPEMMWNELRHIQVAKNPATALNSVQHSLSDSLFNNLLGVNRGAYNPTIANIGSSIRSVTSMARLGKIVLRSIPDISNIAGMAQRAGVGYWGAYFNAIINAFNLMPGASRRLLAKNMSASLNVHMGTVSRYIDTSGMGDTVNKLSNKFFHGLGLSNWDKGNKLSAMDPIMKGYGRSSTKPFNSLNSQQQSYLKRFNISELEWDALRAKTEKRLFATDNVDNMSESEIRDLWSKGDKIVPLSDYRATLYRKVFAMFDTAHEFAVLNPTAFTNMITTGNLRAGTAGGEAVRMIMQFKGYPIQYMKRVWIGGMQDFDSYQAKMMYGLNMSLGTIMLASLSEVLVAIASGLTPPDPTKMSRSEQIKYYSKLLAGGLGVFGTILNDKTTAKTVAASMVGTPSWRFVADPLISAISLATGDLKGAKNAAKDFVNVANPIGTVPVLSPYVDSFLGNKPYTEPGQRPLF